MHEFRRMQRVKRILLLALVVCIVLILIGGSIFIFFIKKGQTEAIENDFLVLNSTPKSVFVNPMHVLMFDKNETKIENPATSKTILDIYKAYLIGQNEARKLNLTISDSLRHNWTGQNRWGSADIDVGLNLVKQKLTQLMLKPIS